jgi:hypothetical protein
MILTYEGGREDDFFTYCIHEAGSISCGGEVQVEGMLKDLHNNFQGNTQSIGAKELFQQGWVRFAMKEGKVSVETDSPTVEPLTEIAMTLLPYADKEMVIAHNGESVSIETPSSSTVLATLNVEDRFDSIANRLMENGDGTNRQYA